MKRCVILCLLPFLFFMECNKKSYQDQEISLEVHEGTTLGFDLSPDGKTIVFDLLGQLWLMPVSGGEAIPLTDAIMDQAEDIQPVFSPDGKQIAFRSDRPGSKGFNGIWLISIENKEVKQLVSGGNFWFPAIWSPNGNQIARVGGKSSIDFLDIDTGEEKSVRIKGLPNPRIQDITWSPDGKRLAFVNDRQTWSYRGNRIWEVSVVGGEAVPLTPENIFGMAPAYSPDGCRIAFFTRDIEGKAQLWTKERDAEALKLTDHEETRWIICAPRWSPDGSSIIYTANGRLWQISTDGGKPKEIPFTAKLNFMRKRGRLNPVRFPPPGAKVKARGNMGMAISTDGGSIALIVLGKLWVYDVGGRFHTVTQMPPTAEDLSWSPDGKEVVWSAGPAGTEDLFVTNIETGKTRQVTAFLGREYRASFSPDGRFIAFYHWQKPGLSTPAWEQKDDEVRLRIIPAENKFSDLLENALDLGKASNIYEVASAYGFGQGVLQWSPDSQGLLQIITGESSEKGMLYDLNGEKHNLGSFSKSPNFLNWMADDSIVFMHNNMLWKSRFTRKSDREDEASDLSPEAAFNPTAAHDGSILYISGDGLRIRRSNGSVEHIGWPISYTVPVPERLLIRDIKIIDGKGSGPSDLKDILIESGRIVRIAPARKIKEKKATQIISAQGRTVIPGLIDAHTHMRDYFQLPGFLFHGVTTVRDMGSAISRLAGWRDAIDAGIIAGPRIVFGGFQFYHEIPSLSGESGSQFQSPLDSDGMTRAISILRAFGGVFTKMYWGGGWERGGELIKQAHAAGMSVSGHVAAPLPLIAAGIEGKEHLGSGSGARSDGTYYEDILQLFKAANLWGVSTIAVHSTRMDLYNNPELFEKPDTAPFITPFMRWWGTRYNHPRRLNYERRTTERNKKAARSAAKKMHDAGISVAAGTDVSEFPWSMHKELEELVAAGLTPLEALRSATEIGARVIGAEDEIGTIEEGKWADLVILDANPLDDIRNTRKIWLVIKGGKVVDREALLKSSR